MSNNNLLEELITSDDEQSPPASFKDADKSIALAVSKNLLKILEVTKQTCDVNNTLRLSVLENIKKMYQTSAQGYSEVDDEVTEMLNRCYIDHIENAQSRNSEDKVNRLLVNLLMKNMKNMEINYQHEPSVNPDIIQAFLNLNENGVHLDMFLDYITHSNALHPQYCRERADMWTSALGSSFKEKHDVCYKMKPVIEKILLSACYDILTNISHNISQTIQSNVFLIELLERCSKSSECFQICIGVLHFLYTMTNFDLHLQNFIYCFVNEVKLISPHESISVLYPLNLYNLALILDTDLNTMPMEVKNEYTSRAMKYIQEVHQESESNLILLLSHYPQWYDIYFKD